jgi:ParB family transcriptional regulator, chromosome partitioning protein
MHKALGRGLESLLPSSTAVAELPGESVSVIQIEKIKPNRFQPRTNFDPKKLQELAESISRHGLAQPLIVTPSAIPGEYELIAGERRLRACQIAGVKEISVVMRQATEKERFEVSLIENLQREDLNPIEEAIAFKRLCEEQNLTQEELAKSMGKDRSVVANSMRLLSLLPEIQQAIISGSLSAGHGRILAGIDDPVRQKLLAERAMNKKHSVRELEAIVSNWKSIISSKKGKKAKLESELEGLAEELQRIYGTKVKLVGKSTRGRIELHYYSLDDLERISYMLKEKAKK